jgi:hypothetical protein
MAETKTPARKPRTAAPVVIADASTLMADLIEATNETVTVEGTAVPAAVIQKPTTDAGVNLADKLGLAPTPAELPVPVALTVAQIASKAMRVEIDKAWSMFYGKRAQGAAAFVEPTEDKIEELVGAYMTEHGVKMMKAAFAVKDQIDLDRAAHAAAAADQGKIDLEWLRAGQHEIKELLLNVEQMIVSAGGKASSTTSKPRAASSDSPSTTRGPSVSWSAMAPKLLDYAESIGLVGFYFVDVTVGGYKGAYHAVRLHRDGTWTKANYNPETNQIEDTGVQVPTWKYFDKNGDDRTDATPKDMVPQHALSKNEMFGVLMLKKDGTILDLDGVTADRRDDKGARIVGTRKDYAFNDSFFAAAGVPFKTK